MTSPAELLPRYQRLRIVGRELNTKIVKRLKKDVLDEGGKKLGILKGNVLVLDSEDEMAVLMDYCIYEIRRHGRTAVEDYLAETPPPPDSDEMVFLKGMQHARHSLFLIESVEPGVGITVRDLLRDDTHIVTDVNFSRTAQPGLVIAFRLIAPENIAMTTGAALPVGLLPESERGAWLQQLLGELKRTDFTNLSLPEATEVSTTIIRACLQLGAAEQVVYEEPNRSRSLGRAPIAATPTRRVGRNDRCPCGSGKKFKHCCGARR